MGLYSSSIFLILVPPGYQNCLILLIGIWLWFGSLSSGRKTSIWCLIHVHPGFPWPKCQEALHRMGNQGGPDGTISCHDRQSFSITGELLRAIYTVSHLWYHQVDYQGEGTMNFMLEGECFPSLENAIADLYPHLILTKVLFSSLTSMIWTDIPLIFSYLGASRCVYSGL